MGSQVLQNQPGSESAWCLDIFMQDDERTGYILSIGLLTFALSLFGYGNGNIEL